MKKDEGKIVLVSGSKGGSGQSFISNCLGSYLAIHTDKNILIVDFNTGKTDSRIIYGIQDKNIKSLYDIKNMSGEADEALLKKIIINFDNSLNLIFPPLYFDNLKTVTFKNFTRILSYLKKYFDIILIDEPTVFGLRNNENSIYDHIDKLLLVSLPDLVSLSNLNVMINQLQGSIEYLNPKLIINKYNIKPSVSFALLNTILKYPVEYFLPFDRDIEQLYLEKGPACIFKYNLKITRDLAAIGDNMIKELF
jgi:MinD-like ATPase involved in chromosome partitioning or flagellar assembly